MLTREFAVVYQALANGETPVLAELELQYADFAQSQREWLCGKGLEPQWRYWSEQLKDAPSGIDLVTDLPSARISEPRGQTLCFRLEPGLAQALHGFSRRHDVTLFMTLLTSFSLLLCHYSGQEDLPVGVAIANRNRRELENLIGFFVNSLVLRHDLSGDPTFAGLLARVRDLTIKGFANQDYPFNLLVQRLKPDRISTHNPMFNVMFALQNAPTEDLVLPDLTFERLQLRDRTAIRFVRGADRTPRGLDSDGRGISRRPFRTRDHPAHGPAFERILEEVVRNPHRSISTYPELDDSEKRRLLSGRGQPAQRASKGPRSK